jgi:hypothetical protein
MVGIPSCLITITFVPLCAYGFGMPRAVIPTKTY